MPSGGIKDIQKLTREIMGYNDKAETFLKRTMSDAKKRAPSWIAQGVAKEYNASSAKVKSFGRLKVKGDLQHLQFKYSGAALDVMDFPHTPKELKPGYRSYTLTSTVKRGKKKEISKVKRPTKAQYRKNIAKNFRREGTRNSPSSPVMLMRMSNQRNYHPFQRVSQNRTDLEMRSKTVSLPQMVTIGENGSLHPEPAKVFNEGIAKRIEHERSRFFK